MATRTTIRTSILGGDGASASRETINAQFEASTSLNVVRVLFADSPFTPELTDECVLCDATGGAITVALQPLADAANRVLVVKKTDSSGNAVTIDGDGSEQVEIAAGTLAATRSLATQGASARLLADTAWFVV
jgi:hypothetical protein